MRDFNHQVSGTPQSVKQTFALLARHISRKKNLSDRAIETFKKMQSQFFAICKIIDVTSETSQEHLINSLNNFQEVELVNIVGDNYKQSDIHDYLNKTISHDRQALNGDFKRGPYRSYTHEQKQRVISLHEQGYNYNSISRMLKIPPKNIVRWCKNGTERKPGAGRKVFDPQMEQQLVQWIYDNYLEGSFIDPQVIQMKAKSISRTKNFTASTGWFKNFLNRSKINQTYTFKENRH